VVTDVDTVGSSIITSGASFDDTSDGGVDSVAKRDR